MKISDFIKKVDSLYLGSSMETHVYVEGYETIPQWIGTASYTFKDSDGNDRILKRLSWNSWYADRVDYNVMACFNMSGDDFSSWYYWLSNMIDYLKKSMDDGNMVEDDELYIMHGQLMSESKCLYEITDISYSSDRMGTYIVIYTEPVDIRDAIINKKSREWRNKFIKENCLSEIPSINSKDVLSVKQVQNLLSKGIDMSDAIMCWLYPQDELYKKDSSKWELCNADFYKKHCDDSAWFDVPTYTLSELLDKLPEKVVCDDVTYRLVVNKSIVGYYSDDNPDDCHYADSYAVGDGNILEAVYKLYLWYLNDVL